MTAQLSADERLDLGQQFARLKAGGLTDLAIARMHHVSEYRVRDCLGSISDLDAKGRTSWSYLSPADIRMLHAIRDEIRAADRRAVELEIKR